MIRRLLTALVFATLAVVPFAGSTAHATSSIRSVGKILGVVRPIGTSNLPCVGAIGVGNCYGSLYYNNGPVMTINKVYTIYWIPSGFSVSANYIKLINQYFQDVSADRGKQSGTYGSTTQYSQTQNGVTSYIQNNSTFAGYAIDTSPLPAVDHISCPYSPTPTACLTDAQLQQEISNVIHANNWPVDNNTEFFMYTAKGIGSCFPTYTYQSTPVGNVNGPLCFAQAAPGGYCAYHSWYYDSTINPNAEIIYSNMPYANSDQVSSAGCDFGQHPNGDDADATINVTSHEHQESITDPYGTGWWDSNPSDPNSGMENGDLCAWNFGTPSGASGAQWTNTINGHHYFMQQEWSNADGGCVLSEKPKLSLTPNVGFPTAPFRISGLFYNANESVPFTWSSAGSSAQESLGTVTTDASGHFSPIMTKVPADATPGNGTVSGTGSVSQTTGSASFNVPQ